MNKRLKIMTYVASLLLVAVIVFTALDGTFMRRKYDSVWSDKYIEGLADDREKLAAYALRSASSHNTQPWLVKMEGQDSLKLYLDKAKALPAVDGEYRQMLMSQGAFIEGCKKGAEDMGLKIDVSYGDLSFDGELPLAAEMTIVERVEADGIDAVSSSTYNASSNGLKPDIDMALEDCIGEYPSLSYTMINGGDELEELQGFLMKGTIIESGDEEAMKELMSVFRWTEREKNEHRYGLSLNMMPALLKPFIQPIMKHSSGDWEKFGESGIKMFEKRLKAQKGYILVKCENPGDLDYVHAGQLYQRLIFEAAGYELRPAMQVLENYEAMQSLHDKFRQRFGSDGEVLMIIGMKEKAGSPSAGNPRHLVDDILVE